MRTIPIIQANVKTSSRLTWEERAITDWLNDPKAAKQIPLKRVKTETDYSYIAHIKKSAFVYDPVKKVLSVNLEEDTANRIMGLNLSPEVITDAVKREVDGKNLVSATIRKFTMVNLVANDDYGSFPGIDSKVK